MTSFVKYKIFGSREGEDNDKEIMGLVANSTKNDPLVEEEKILINAAAEHEFDQAMKKILVPISTGSKTEDVPLIPPTSETLQDEYTRMPHLYQEEVWDCGIACVLMVLRWLKQQQQQDDQVLPDSWLEEEEATRQRLLDMIGSDSIWTADLVLQIHHVFHNLPSNYLLCSKTLVVDQDYEAVGYYRAAFANDRVRVTQTFQDLNHLGANMLCLPDLPLRHVLDAVRHPRCVAIVLVDNFILHNNIVDGEDRYIGHYVVLCGISRCKKDIESAHALEGMGGIEEDYCVILCNPGQHQMRFLAITPSRFERAWKAKGTDDDIIFIFR